MSRVRRRREAKDFRRQTGQRGQIKNLILIVCEGKQTEPNYFRGFNAIGTTRQLRNFHSAYSNEAFELWYVLHFEYLNSGITRQDYIKKLNKYLDDRYKKNDPAIYQLLLEKGNQQQAIKNAERLLACCSPSNPAEDNPSTTVHELVKVLNQYKLKGQ